LLDCGKTFSESSRTWFASNNITKLDAVILTHGHADAMMGLDDLRAWSRALGITLPIYLNKETFGACQSAFPYLIDRNKASGGGVLPRLEFVVVNQTFTVDGLEFVPLPVEHGVKSDGSPYISWGFRFDDVVYISDVSAIPDETRALLHNSRVMVLDAIAYHENVRIVSHYVISDAIAEFQLYRPKLSVLTGLGHALDYSALAEDLEVIKETEDLNILPSYDGLVIPLNR